MKTATEPRWTYEINIYSGKRSFWIYLTSLDRSSGKGRLTPAEVQAELVAERAECPYTPVMWGTETGRALKEKYQTEVSGWKALTGEAIDPHPHDPSRPQPYSKCHSGPSSTYGSDSGAGGYGGLGGFGGSY